jgi:hypothetical protein
LGPGQPPAASSGLSLAALFTADDEPEEAPVKMPARPNRQIDEFMEQLKRRQEVIANALADACVCVHVCVFVCLLAYACVCMSFPLSVQGIGGWSVMC